MSEKTSENVGTPPLSNTGAQNQKQSGLSACLDWVEGTLFFGESPENLIQFLGLSDSDFFESPRGMDGYKKMRLSESQNIRILYDGNTDMGMHFIITGQGCREFESKSNKTWEQLFQDVFDSRGKFTRIDGAIDDMNEKPFFTVSKLKRRVQDNLCSSKFKTAGTPPVEWRIADGKEIEKETLYFGSRQSRVFVRFYNKLMEYEQKGYEVPENVTSWIRTEVVFREDRADAIAQHILDGKPVGELISGVLKNYIKFLREAKDKKGKRKRKDLLPVAKFWTDFLGDAEKVKLAEPLKKLFVHQKEKWFKKNMKHVIGEITLAKLLDGSIENWNEKFMMECVDELPKERAQRVEREVEVMRRYKELNVKVYHGEITEEEEAERVSIESMYKEKEEAAKLGSKGDSLNKQLN